MSTLAPLLRAQRRLIPSRDPSGVARTGVPGVLFFWSDRPTPRSPLLYDSGIVIVGQGHKVGYLGGRRFEYDAETCLVLGVPVPLDCESHGTAEEPLLGIRIDIDLGRLHPLVARFAGKLGLEDGDPSQVHSGVEPLRMEGALLDATARLLGALDDAMDREVVGAAAVEEILYRVLRSEQGRVLFSLTRQHTPYSTIARALELMHRDFRAPLSVEGLARASAMGVSSFHRAFKEVTGQTPLQYLKRIRLLKAKDLLVFDGARVEQAAHAVGYASPSQFSREFKRYFQRPPSEAQALPYSDRLQAVRSGPAEG